MERTPVPEREETKPRARAVIAGLLLSLSGVIFILANHIAESIYPGFSVNANFLSDLGATGNNTTLFWDSQLLVAAVLWLLGMYFFLRMNKKGKSVWILFLLAPVGQLVVSLFPENTILVIHSVGALLAFVTGGLSAIYAYKLTRKPFAYLSFSLGAVSLISLVFFLSGMDLGLGPGGMERMVVYPLALWLVALGGHLMALYRPT